MGVVAKLPLERNFKLEHVKEVCKFLCFLVAYHALHLKLPT